MKKIIAMLLALIMVFALVACGGGNTDQPSTPDASKAPDQGSSSGDGSNTPADPIKIGIIHEGSGALEGWGKQELQGIMCGLYYATDGTMEINGRPLEVIVEDTTGDVGVAIQKATKLMEDDKVDFLAGSCSSAIVLAVMDKAAELKVPYMVSGGASDDITGAHFNEYTFRVARTMSMATNSGLRFAEMQQGGMEGSTWAILCPDYAGGRDGGKALRTTVEKAGGVILEEIYAPMDCADFTPYIQKIMAAKPQYLTLTIVGNNYTVKLPQQLREMGALENTVMSASIVDFDFLNAMGTNGIGLTGECIYNYALFDTPVNKEFIEIHKELYDGALPDYFAGQGFAGGQAMVEAFKKAGTTEAADLIKALEGMEFESVKGTMKIRAEDHQALQPMAVGTIVDDGNGGIKVDLAWMCPTEELTFPVTAPGR